MHPLNFEAVVWNARLLEGPDFLVYLIFCCSRFTRSSTKVSFTEYPIIGGLQEDVPPGSGASGGNRLSSLCLERSRLVLSSGYVSDAGSCFWHNMFIIDLLLRSSEDGQRQPSQISRRSGAYLPEFLCRLLFGFRRFWRRSREFMLPTIYSRGEGWIPSH